MKKLATAFMLVLGLVLLLMNHQLKTKERAYNARVQQIRIDKADYLFDEVIPKINIDADKFVTELKSEIIRIMDSYDSKLELRTELLDNLNGRNTHSAFFESLGKMIQGKTLNNVPQNQADNNDPIVLMRNPESDEYVIIIDMSENCATEDRFRNAEKEATGEKTKDNYGQFADKLFYQAYSDLEKNKTITFWSYLTPPIDSAWYDNIYNMTSTDMKDLKAFYLKHNANNESLRTIEILVSDKIHRYEDYWGESTKNPNGSYTKQDMPIVVISGYNILDQLDLKVDFKNKLESYDREINNEVERFITYKFQNDVFSIIIIITFIMLFLYTHDHKKR